MYYDIDCEINFDIDFDDMGRFNQYVRKFSDKLLMLYVNFT